MKEAPDRDVSEECIMLPLSDSNHLAVLLTFGHTLIFESVVDVSGCDQVRAVQRDVQRMWQH